VVSSYPRSITKMSISVRRREDIKEEPDLSWVGTRVKLAQNGTCPFCRATVDFGAPHRCPELPRLKRNQIFTTIFPDGSALLVGPTNEVSAIAEITRERYGITNLSIICSGYL